MSRRTPVLLIGLTVGDYLLWNWSLNGSHDVIALIAGLTLPPLVLVSLWVLAFAAMQVIAATTRLAHGRRGGRVSSSSPVTVRSAGARGRTVGARRSAPPPAAGRAAHAAARERSGKIAA